MTAPAKRLRPPALPGMLALAFPGVVALFTALLWAAEGWQRPLALAGVREEWWLAAACAGAAVVLLGTGRRMRRGRRWLLLPAAAGFALILPVAREAMTSNAVRHLIERLLADDSPPPSKFEKTRDALRDWLDDKKWPSHWLGKEDEQRDWEEEWSWACHRLEASRPDLRRRFALAAMHQNGPIKINGRLAAAHWRWLFPAVTGQDVTLTQRRRLWDELQKLHDNAQAPPDSRMAAALWLGLIVLSDPESFAEWRPLARDALLAWNYPPYSDNGDVWMRALDLLLAFDSEAEQARLTAPHAVRPAWLRRAVRERVRGVRPHLDAALAEIRRAGAAGEYGPALALWADVRGFDASVLRDGDDSRVAAALQEILAGWLLRDDLSPVIPVCHRPDRGNNYDHQVGFWEWLAVETADGPGPSLLAPETRVRLDERASVLLARLEKARTWYSGPQGLSPGAPVWEAGPQGPPRAWYSKPQLSPAAATILRDLDRLLVLRTISGAPAREELTQRLGDLMVDLAWGEDATTREDFELLDFEWLGRQEIVRRLAGIWPDIRPADRNRFNQMARSVPAMSGPSWSMFLDEYRSSRNWLVAMDTASESPQLSPVECLAACFPDYTGKSFHAGNGRPTAPQVDGRLLFPEISGPELASAIDELLAMISSEEKAAGTMPRRNGIEKFRGDTRRYGLESSPGDYVRLQLLRDRSLGKREASQQWLVDLVVSPKVRSTLIFQGSDLPWMGAAASPHNARALLADLSTLAEDIGFEAGLLDRFSDYLVRSSPDPEVIREVVAWLESATAAPDSKLAFSAHAALLRLATAGLAPGADTIRARLLRAIQTRQPALDEWPGESGGFTPDQWGPRSRWSEQVSWADDALAAEFAWSSQIKRETGIRAHAIDGPSHGPVFTYLAAGLDFTGRSWDYLSAVFLPEATTPARSCRRRGGPPALPLEPTPWQRARELHQRRPDLAFPDRAALRRELGE